MSGKQRTLAIIAALLCLLWADRVAVAQVDLGPEQQVQAYDAPILVTGYSVPSLADWNEDGLPDLIVGEGSGSTPDARIRVYRNVGSPGDPRFEGYFFAQSGAWDLAVPGGG